MSLRYLRPLDPGTMGPWDAATLGPLDLWTQGPWDSWTFWPFPFTTSSYFLLPPPTSYSYILLPPSTLSYLLLSYILWLWFGLVWFGLVGYGRGGDVRWLVSSYVKRFQCYSTQKSFVVVVGDIAEIWNRPWDSWLLEFTWTPAWQQQDNCVCDSIFWTWVVNFWTSFIVTKM